MFGSPPSSSFVDVSAMCAALKVGQGDLKIFVTKDHYLNLNWNVRCQSRARDRVIFLNGLVSFL